MSDFRPFVKAATVNKRCHEEGIFSSNFQQYGLDNFSYTPLNERNFLTARYFSFFFVHI